MWKAFRKVAPRVLGHSRAAASAKRPPVFIEGDRLLPDQIKPWAGSGSVPIRVSPRGLGILQVSSAGIKSTLPSCLFSNINSKS